MAMAVQRPERQDWTYRAARKRMLRAGRAQLPSHVATARLDEAGNRIVGCHCGWTGNASAGPTTSIAFASGACRGSAAQAQIDRSARWQDAARNGLTFGSSVVSRRWSLRSPFVC